MFALGVLGFAIESCLVAPVNLLYQGFLALLKDCMVVLPLEAAWTEVASVKTVIRA